MNPATFASPPSDACTLGTAGSYGPDRITQNTYDAAGRLTQAVQALGTSVQRTYATYTYSNNGKQLSVKDANGNLTGYAYDGFDRLITTTFPSTTLGAGTTNANDHESYAYDYNGNRTSLSRRNGQTLTFTYDALNRQIRKDVPGASSVYTKYDATGAVLSVTFASLTGTGTYYAYDGLGRQTSETTSGKTVSFQYDLNGNRTRVTWPDGFYAGYVYDALDRVTAVNENGATSGVGVLAIYSYDSRGRRTGLARGNTTTTTWSYDNLDRLTGLSHDLAGTAYDQSSTFTFSPASQLTSKTETNTVYLWTNYPSGTASTWDGLNRDAAVAAMNPPTCPTATLPTNAGYDCNGNQLQDASGVRHFTYDAESRLLTTSGLSTNLSLSYDPMGRLQQTQASGGSTATTLFLYEGSRLIAEYDTSGNVLQRYVHGSGVDEPIVWYEGSGTTTRHFLHTDRQGSVIALSDSSGAETATYAYGPYGEPQAWGGSRFSYTGQIQLPEAKLYHYKARVYDPATGRFLQTDPIGYKDDLDWYAYVGGDPVNVNDPSGLAQLATDPNKGAHCDPNGNCPLTVTGHKLSCPTKTTCYETKNTIWLDSPRPIKPQKKKVHRKPQSKGCAAVSRGSTAQVGAASQGTLGVFSYQVSVGLAFDTHGNVALYATGGLGGGLGGGGDVGVTVQTSNAPTVQDLAGLFVNGSGGGGLVGGGTIDAFGGAARNGQSIVGGGFTAGGAAGETSFEGATGTLVSPSLNLLGKPIC